jgi:thymidylate synthase
MYYKNESGYIELLKNTLNGYKKTTRNGNVFSQFGCMVKFDNIGDNFPLITTKKMFFRGIVEELLWFLRGSTNSNELREKEVHIWNGNSSREYLDSVGLNYDEGELGPVYGWQWRKFGKKYNDNKEYNVGIDQIKYIIEELQKDSNSRRAVLSAWNPPDLNKMSLPPCHILYIFNKSDKGLSCHMTLRSSDLFLGLPFNIASTALLTQILAHVLHMESSEICLSICDAHIYEEHIEQVNKQINHQQSKSPTVEIIKEAPPIISSVEEKIMWIESLKYEDFKLNNYNSCPSLPAIMK